jgi:hypothetical protein
MCPYDRAPRSRAYPFDEITPELVWTGATRWAELSHEPLIGSLPSTAEFGPSLTDPTCAGTVAGERLALRMRILTWRAGSEQTLCAVMVAVLCTRRRVGHRGHGDDP